MTTMMIVVLDACQVWSKFPMLVTCVAAFTRHAAMLERLLSSLVCQPADSCSSRLLWWRMSA